MNADEIDALTIREVRAIAERAGEALKQLRDVQALLGAPNARIGPVPHSAALNGGLPTYAPNSGEPYPCPGCGRAGPIAPGESAGPTECLQCGNPTPLAAGAPGVRLTNKGPMVVDIEARNRLMASPAFDANGDPT